MKKSKTLLVTGGAGFIGSNFINYYLAKHEQDKIINLDALTYAGNLENLKKVKKNPRYSFIKGNICNQKLVNNIVKDIDIIVHFAAESHVDRSITGPQIFVQTNVLGTQVLLDASVKHNIQLFHHISTDEVFGSLEINSNEKFTETTPYDPRSPYSASKAGSDHLVRAYSETYGLPYLITNCSNNYGEYQFPEKFFALSITNILENKKIPVYGDGQNIRDWLYVQDHCKAIDLLLHSGQQNQTFMIGGLKKDYSNLEIAKLILKIMNKDESHIEFIKDRPGHDRKYSVDWSKINHQVQWKPSVDLMQGLTKTINWYKQNQSWWKKLKQQNKDYYTKQYQKQRSMNYE